MTDAHPPGSMTAPRPHLALIETAGALPGLFPAAAWEALHAARVIVARDLDANPAVPALRAAGFVVESFEPATTPVPLTGRDLLSAPPTPAAARARGLLALAREHGDVACLLDPDDATFGRDVGMAAARDVDVEVEFVFLVGAPRGLALLDLVAVFDRLLDPADGCPWDLEQDHDSLAPHLVEETYEALEAIAAGDDDAMAEELGDVLMQVVFHAKVAEGRRAFDVDDVARGIAEKLRRRHPHVFGDDQVADADEVRANWDAIKATEKPERTSPFDGIVRAMPALPLAGKVVSRAGVLGWTPDPREAVDLLASAVADVEAALVADGAGASDHRDGAIDPAAGDDDPVGEAIGRVGVALAAVAAATGEDADGRIRQAVDVLVGRFEAAGRRTAARGTTPTTTAAWQQALDEAAAAGW